MDNLKEKWSILFFIMFFMCEGKVRNFNYYSLAIFFIIISQRKQRKMQENINICCYSYQVTNKCYCINGVRILTVIVSSMRAAREDRDQRSFFSDESLSKHQSELFCLTYRRLGKHLLAMRK